MTTRIFDPKGAGRFSAQVGSDGSHGWHSPLSYLRAADVLVEHATERAGSVALSALPICFLYRHAAELTLKQLIFQTEELITINVALGYADAAHERKSEDVEKHVVKQKHRIGDLLALLEERLAIVSDETVPDEHRDALAELAQFDATGDRFRYSRVKKGALFVPSFDERAEIDIVRVHTQLGDAVRFLQDCVGGFLDHQIDLGNEVFAETANVFAY